MWLARLQVWAKYTKTRKLTSFFSYFHIVFVSFRFVPIWFTICFVLICFTRLVCILFWHSQQFLSFSPVSTQFSYFHTQTTHILISFIWLIVLFLFCWCWLLSLIFKLSNFQTFALLFLFFLANFFYPEFNQMTHELGFFFFLRSKSFLACFCFCLSSIAKTKRFSFNFFSFTSCCFFSYWKWRRKKTQKNWQKGFKYLIFNQIEMQLKVIEEIDK